jgi:hypothetical protein
MQSRHAAGLTVLLALVAGGCGSNDESKPRSLPQGGDPVSLKPGDFSTRIDNPYWPMAPGTTWRYRETEDGKVLTNVVTVTPATKHIAGIETRVIHDVVREGSRVVEATYDWYAQDKAGNVWYLGEETSEYTPGKPVSTKGSWQAGVHGAQAGIALPADPKPGMSYRQEYAAGEAEDRGRILSVDEKAEVPFGSFDRVVMTKDYSPLEPQLLEHKFYARGVGPVLTIPSSGGSGREELVSFKRG